MNNPLPITQPGKMPVSIPMHTSVLTTVQLLLYYVVHMS